MNSAAIQVRGLQKSFKGAKGTKTEVLTGVNFEVRRGEIFALLGSNSAGKTTIVNILSTLLKHDGGNAGVCGFDVARQPDKVRESISLTGQFAAVDEILTGRENLILIAKLRNIKNPAQLADSLLTRFGLSDAANKRAGTYSGGMKRKLDIAMSIIGKPAVIPGLMAKSAEGASVFSYPLIFLPMFSSAFAPTETMPAAVRWFAENQPVTSIVETVRSLLNGETVGNDIWIALAWCAGITAVAWFFAMRAYKRWVS